MDELKPLRYAEQNITDADVRAVCDVLRSDYITQGPKVREFEDALAAYVGAKHAVAVSSGTAALYLALLGAKALGGELIVTTSPLSFIATANAVLLAGAEVAFEDVDAITGNMKVHTVGSVVVPVHFAGRACKVPDDTATWFIEDACHALGAMDYDGCSRVGSCAHSLASIFSFHPAKPIATGEGGAVVTNYEGFAQGIRSLRDHGREDGLMVRLGGNYRMNEIQAALGLSQLARCDEMRERRFALAEAYYRTSGLAEIVTLPPWPTQTSWHLFPVRIKHGRRDEVMAKLRAQGIGVQKHYDPIIPLHPYYRERFGYVPGTWPNAEAWAAEELSLPLHARMTEADVVRVCDALKVALG